MPLTVLNTMPPPAGQSTQYPAISDDGTRMVVQSHGTTGGVVKEYAWDAVNSEWDFVQTIQAAGPQSAPVTMSGDGNVIWYFGPAFDGAPVVKIYSGGTWTSGGSLLYPTGFSGGKLIFNYDGTLAVWYTFKDSNGDLYRYTYERSGTTWTQVNAVNFGGAGNYNGAPIRIASDGKLYAVEDIDAGPSSDGDVNIVIYARSGAGWTSLGSRALNAELEVWTKSIWASDDGEYVMHGQDGWEPAPRALRFYQNGVGSYSEIEQQEAPTGFAFGYIYTAITRDFSRLVATAFNNTTSTYDIITYDTGYDVDGGGEEPVAQELPLRRTLTLTWDYLRAVEAEWVTATSYQVLAEFISLGGDATEVAGEIDLYAPLFGVVSQELVSLSDMGAGRVEAEFEGGTAVTNFVSREFEAWMGYGLGVEVEFVSVNSFSDGVEAEFVTGSDMPSNGTVVVEFVSFNFMPQGTSVTPHQKPILTIDRESV